MTIAPPTPPPSADPTASSAPSPHAILEKYGVWDAIDVLVALGEKRERAVGWVEQALATGAVGSQALIAKALEFRTNVKYGKP